MRRRKEKKRMCAPIDLSENMEREKEGTERNHHHDNMRKPKKKENNNTKQRSAKISKTRTRRR